MVFFLFGLFNSYRIIVNKQEFDMNTDLKIVHISDTHFLNNMKLSTYEKMIDKVNDSNPDLIIFTGDVFTTHDLDDNLVENVTEFFKSFECENKYAVMGNHDYYGDAEDTVKRILSDAEFNLLINQNVQVTVNDIDYNVIGLDDLMKGNSNYSQILETTNNYDHNIVLSHEPDTFDSIHPYNVKYVFSGHSHGGQLRLPFIGDIYNVPGAKKYSQKQYTINDTMLFVSFGLGESVIPFRLFNNRSIEIYDYS